MKIEDIYPYKEEILNNLAEVVSYDSSYHNDVLPFGQGNIDCLNSFLKMAAGYGFKTVNLGNYCGYVEMGQGEEIIGILAHLDVIPATDSWNTDPFKLTIIDDKIYGRGTTDDKGAAVCSLMALKLLKEHEASFTKRVRLILGCNEETGSLGVAHYIEKEGYVNCGFTPDGYFPLVFGEKGRVGGIFKGKSEKITDIKAGTVVNAVASKCRIVLKDHCINEKKLNQFFKANNIKYTFENNILMVYGTAAHASTPELGVNAISYAMEGLYASDINDSLVDQYHQLIGLDYNGTNASVGFGDNYGKLTFNIGIAYKEKDELCFSIDIRFPLTYKAEQITQPLMEAMKGQIEITDTGEQLFFPLDHPMITALMDAYQKVTGDTDSKPKAIGGGTYAKSMKNIVAFGCEDGITDYHIHDDNEYTTFPALATQIACYYEAILNLMKI